MDIWTYIHIHTHKSVTLKKKCYQKNVSMEFSYHVPGIVQLKGI